MHSAFGKARGTVLRLALVLEHLWWCAKDDARTSPKEISVEAFISADHFVSNYLMPMAERVYGDAATPVIDRNVATLARWITKKQPSEVHVRSLLREERLPGLKNAETVRAAAEALIEAGWLAPLGKGSNKGRAKVAYPVNPAVFVGPP